MIITSRGWLDAGSLGRLPTEKGGQIGFGNMKRDAVIGGEGVIGFTEELEGAPYIKVTIIDSTEVDKQKLKNFMGETLVYNTNNGQQFVLTGAWVGNAIELNVDDGKIAIEFYGTELV